jgi:hypothetical protein
MAVIVEQIEIVIVEQIEIVIVEQIGIVIVEQIGIAGFILDLGVQVCANQLFPHLPI